MSGHQAVAGQIREVPRVLMFETFPAKGRAGQRLEALLAPAVRLDIVHAPGPGRDLRGVRQWCDYAHDELHRRRVTAPYWLLGHSFGGIVALELARRLTAAGSHVAYVGMIDTWRPEQHPRTVGEKLMFVTTEFANRPPGGRATFIADQARASLRYRSRQLRVALESARARVMGKRRDHDPSGSDWREGDRQDERDALLRAVQLSWVRYKATPVTFPVALFWCRRSFEHWGGDPSLGWSPYLRAGFEQYPVAGDHMSLMADEHIQSLTTAILVSVARAAAWNAAARGSAREEEPDDG